MSVRVGVDGGQSRLRLAVTARPDEVFEAPGFSYHAGEPVAATVDAVRQAWAAAGVTEPVERAVLGLTGLPSIASLRDALAAGIARTLGHPRGRAVRRQRHRPRRRAARRRTASR